MKHLFHGLFGSPSIWDPLFLNRQDTIRHDLYVEKKSELLSMKTHSEDVLIGYSLGGRIALEIAIRNSFNLRKVFLLSTHPGLLKEERHQRRAWEDEVLQKMVTMSAEEFTNYWDSLPLFSSSKLQGLDSTLDLRKSAEVFASYRLSEMSPDPESYLTYKDKLCWIVGEQDRKYVSLTESRLRGAGIEVIRLNADHRVLTAKKEIEILFRAKGVL